MGLNDIKANDYVNVVVQVCVFCVLTSAHHHPRLWCMWLPFATFSWMRPTLVAFKTRLSLQVCTIGPRLRPTHFVSTVAELIRKLSNPRAFKSHVSPHEFLQAVTNASQKKFKLTEQSDPVEFMTWLLNTLHKKLKKHKKKSIIHKTFQVCQTHCSNVTRCSGQSRHGVSQVAAS